MDKLAQEDHTYHLSREEYLRNQKHWYLTLYKSCKNAPMRLRSDFRAAGTIMNVQKLFFFNSTKGGTLLPQAVHGGIGTKAGGAHDIIHFRKFVAVGSFTADSNLLQPTVCVNSKLHTSLSSFHSAHDS